MLIKLVVCIFAAVAIGWTALSKCLGTVCDVVCAGELPQCQIVCEEPLTPPCNTTCLPHVCHLVPYPAVQLPGLDGAMPTCEISCEQLQCTTVCANPNATAPDCQLQCDAPALVASWGSGCCDDAGDEEDRCSE